MPIQDQVVTNKQHAVPQNIMDVEFKLIGDLTMRQFSYIVVCGLSAYANFQFSVGIFRIPISIILVLLGLGLAFVPIEERGLDQWITNFIKAIYSPNERIWKKVTNIPSAFMYDNLNVVRQELITLAPTSSRRKLEEYLDYQRKRVAKDPLDIPEMEYLLKVRDAFKDVAKSVPSPTFEQPSYVVTSVAVVDAPVAPTVDTIQPSISPIPPISPISSEEEETITEKKTETPQVVKESVKSNKFMEDAKLLIAQKFPHLTINAPVKEVISTTPVFMASPLTPDRHTGRKFVSFLPSQGDLVLPVRGERVLKTADQLEVSVDMTAKNAQLQGLLDQIKTEESGVVSSVAPVEPVKEPEDNRKESIKSLKTQSDIINAFKSLQDEVSNLQNKIRHIPTQNTSKNVAVVSPQDRPNIIRGFVKDVAGSPIENVVLIFKNFRGDPVRATKTNSAGHFELTTPLFNGSYTVEVSPSNNTGLSFDIISLEVKGDVLHPLEIVGK